MRLALIALLAALPCAAQDLPDPGRRLSREEIRQLDADPEKQAQKPGASAPRQDHRPRDPKACDRARTNYQIWCGGPHSRQSYTRQCAEANDLYVQAC